MVNFTKSGIPGFSVTDSFANVRQRLDDVREHNDFGFESVRGYLELGGNRYLAGIDQNPVTHGIECVELRELFKGDMSAQEFAGELAKIGSVPIMEIEMVWWPVERMSFFLYEDVPSAIGWWGKDLTIDKVKAIFAGRIEELDPNVYHLYKEAYSAAGGMGFGWWLVEHYLPYHVDCPNGCGLGETAGGG